MQRRRVSRTPNLTFPLLGALILSYALWKSGALLPLLFVTVLFFALARWWRQQHRQRLQESVLRKAEAIITPNLDALVRRRAQLVQTDAYGTPVLDKWLKEIDLFIDRYVITALTPSEVKVFHEQRGFVAQMIISRTFEDLKARPAYTTFSEGMTPTQFETFCADQLRYFGWNAEVTKRSRDQGVDVIAQKNGIRIVLQCKLYSTPVGNSAVQEVTAARAFERAHRGVVVTNNRYTGPAEQLAATNDVLLLHYLDLPKLDRLIATRAA